MHGLGNTMAVVCQMQNGALSYWPMINTKNLAPVYAPTVPTIDVLYSFQRRKEEITFDAGIRIGVRTMNSIAFYRFRI
jgi:hypothetical protein